MARLIVAGAAGRMGRTLTSLIVQQSSHTLVGAVEAKGVKAVGSDAGEIAGVGPLGVRIADDYAAIAAPDTVTLDFTNATASLEHLAIAAAKGAAIVIGSTGFTPEMEARARELAPKTRTLIAPNMSIGINVLIKLVTEAASLLTGFDAEVLEIHHRTKVDAPSGTALALGTGRRGGARPGFPEISGVWTRGNHGRPPGGSDWGRGAARRRRGRRSHGDFRRSGRAPGADPSHAKPRGVGQRRTARRRLAGAQTQRTVQHPRRAGAVVRGLNARACNIRHRRLIRDRGTNRRVACGFRI